MFNSAVTILKAYIDDVTPYNFYSVEMQRGNNPEDFYYLFNIGGKFYVVFESDYISPSPYQIEEVSQAFGPVVKPLGWLLKKDRISGARLSVLPLDTQIGREQNRDLLVFCPEDSYLRYVVLSVEVDVPSQKRFDPNVYGYGK